MAHNITIRSEEARRPGTYNNPQGGLEQVTGAPVMEYRAMCSCGWQDKAFTRKSAESRANRHTEYPHRA